MTKAKKTIPALLVKSRSVHGFRRCGMKFAPDGVYLTEGDGLTEAVSKTLKQDPDLIVTETEIEADTE